MNKIIDCEQGTAEWYRARMGMPTASEFATVMRTKGRGESGESKERRTYMLKLAGELITGEPMENYSNVHMERGKAMETEARDYYAFVNNVEPQRIGFIVNGLAGGSPDSLIGSDGMLEIKTALPHILIDKLLRGEFPAEHKAQCQGNLWVAEREWIDIEVYWPKMPPFTKRAYRDDTYIRDLDAAVRQFNDELAQVVEHIRGYGTKEVATERPAAPVRKPRAKIEVPKAYATMGELLRSLQTA